MYMNLYIYTVSLSNSIICWHHCTRRFIRISSCTDFCWYMLTLGNYILLVFCFIFYVNGWMCHVQKYTMKPFYSYSSSLCFLYCVCLLFILFILFHSFVLYNVWSCSRTRIMNTFVDIKQLFSFFQSFH